MPIWSFAGSDPSRSAAGEVLEQARDIYRKIGDQLGQANVVCRLASTLQASGDLPGAAELLEEAQGIPVGDAGCRAGSPGRGAAVALDTVLDEGREVPEEWPTSASSRQLAVGVYRGGFM